MTRRLPVASLVVALVALAVSLTGNADRSGTVDRAKAGAGPVVVHPVRRSLVEQVDVAVRPERTQVGRWYVANATITRAEVAPGAELHQGAAVVWVENRPVFALHLPFPLFRDLRGGDDGDDAAAAIQALRDAGFEIPADASFAHPAVKDAIVQMYARAGSVAPIEDRSAEIAEVEAAINASQGNYDQLVAQRQALRAASGPHLRAAETMAVSSWPAVRGHEDASGVGVVGERGVTAEAVGASWIGEFDGDLPEGDCTLEAGSSVAPCVVAIGTVQSGDKSARALVVTLSAGSATNPDETRAVVRIRRAVTPGEVLAVPESAVRRTGDARSVLVLSDRKQVSKEVVTGAAADGWVEVVSGDISPDSALVASP